MADCAFLTWEQVAPSNARSSQCTLKTMQITSGNSCVEYKQQHGESCANFKIALNVTAVINGSLQLGYAILYEDRLIIPTN
jgi:hypothetical protein